jgi:phosphoribosyl 1,2-cyclic phosphate phosphodiesterase
MNEKGNVQFSYGGETHWETIKPFEEFTVGDLTILPFPQDHGDRLSFDFRIGDFAYSTDLNDFPPESFAKLQNLDCWIIEFNRRQSSSDAAKHIYLEKALQFIDKVKPAKAYLTHLNVSMDHDTVSAELPANVHLAYDGLELTF